MAKERYVWTIKERRGLSAESTYHDRIAQSERCNLDDMKGREEGSVPPANRRLCKHCIRQLAWLRTLES